MISSVAYKISIAIKNANPKETTSIEVMQYSLSIIINSTIIITISLLIGWILNNFWATIIFILSLSLLRVCSGGFHLKTATACNIVSIMIYSLIPLFFSLTGYFIWIINSLSLFIMIFFAPNPDKNAQISIRLFPLLKVVSIMLVSSNFLIGSSVIALAFFVQSLTVIPWKRRIKL